MMPEPTVHAWEVRGGMVAETRNGTWQTYEQEQRLGEMFPLVNGGVEDGWMSGDLIAQRRDVLRRVCAYIMARGCLSSSKKYMEEMAALGDLILEGLGLTAADLEGLV